MKTHSNSVFVVALLTGVLFAPSSLLAQDALSVRLGEPALRFASGGIRYSIPNEGIVNEVTGDNQTSGNRMLLGGRDMMYLLLKKGSEAQVGDLYTVYRRIRKVFHPASKQYLGYLFNVLGVAKVVQIDANVATVTVIRSYGAIVPGDLIMRFEPPAVEESMGGDRASDEIRGMIVDLQSDRNMTLVAQRNIVYLDRGSQDGLRMGDLLDLHRTGSGLPRRKVGELKVLSLEDHTATALITRSTSRILQGDRFVFTGRTAAVTSIQEPVMASAGTPSGPASVKPQAVAEAAVSEGPKPVALAGSGKKKMAELLAGRSRFNLDELVDQLEYEPGEVTIKPEGAEILSQIAEYLRTEEGKHIQIEGHADSMEIGPSLRSRYPSNWELSKARASTILRYLVEAGGLDSARVSSVGYGSSRPVAGNATEEGRRKNRRIEIVLYSPDPPSAVSHSPATSEPVLEPSTTMAKGSGPSPLESASDPQPSPDASVGAPEGLAGDSFPTPAPPEILAPASEAPPDAGVK
jgi:chemotaxis protein MotB